MNDIFHLMNEEKERPFVNYHSKKSIVRSFIMPGLGGKTINLQHVYKKQAKILEVK